MFRIDKNSVEYQGVYKKQEQSAPKKVVIPQKTGPSPEEVLKKKLAQMEAASAQKASEMIKSAKAEAAAIVEAAKAETEGIRNAARIEGLEQGEKETEAKQKALEGELRASFSAIVKEIHDETGIQGADMEEGILRLSLAIAEKIIGMELDRDDIVFRKLVTGAIERMDARERFVIHVNRREYDRFFAKGSGWLEDMISCEPFTVVSDAHVPPGGCVLKSSSGVVNAGIALQLERIAKELGIDADPGEQI